MTSSIASPPDASAGLWLLAQATGSLNSLMNVDSPAKFFVVIALIGSIATVITVTVVQLALLSRHQAELEFKRDLVERGLSADEIERIVSSKPTKKSQFVRKQSA